MVYRTNRLMSLVLMALGLLILIRSSKWKAALGPTGIAFVVFILFYVGFASIVEANLSMAISHFNSIFLVVVSAIATRKIVLSRGFPDFLKVLLIIMVLGAWTVFLSPFLAPVYEMHRKTEMINRVGRWMGFFANPNSTGMAGVCALAVCLAGWTLDARSFKIKKYLPAVIAITGIGVMLTFSRSAILSFAVIGLGFAFFASKFNRQTLGAMFCALTILLVSIWFFSGGYENFKFSAAQLARIQSVEKIIEGRAESSDLGGRLGGIQGGLHYWWKSPLIGHGLGSFHKMPVRYFGGLGCHNTHVMVLGETGVIGFVPYLTFLIMFFINSWRLKSFPIRSLCISFFLIFLATGMVAHGVLEDRNYNILMGVCCGLMGVDDQMSRNRNSTSFLHS